MWLSTAMNPTVRSMSGNPGSFAEAVLGHSNANDNEKTMHTRSVARSIPDESQRIQNYAQKSSVSLPSNRFPARTASVSDISNASNLRKLFNTAPFYMHQPDKPGSREIRDLCSTDSKLVATGLAFQPYLFSYMQPHESTRCPHPLCARYTHNLLTTATCPACGPYSYIRYCSTRHLHDDVRRHYRAECGRRLNCLLLDEATMILPNAPTRHFVRCIDAAENDSLERYRQAIFWATPTEMSRGGGYVIYTDLDLCCDSVDGQLEITMELLRRYRGRGHVHTVVKPTDVKHRKWFEESMRTLLSLGQAAKNHRESETDELLIRHFYMVIKDCLTRQRKWNIRMCDRVRFAMRLEFGWQVPEADW